MFHVISRFVLVPYGAFWLVRAAGRHGTFDAFCDGVSADNDALAAHVRAFAPRRWLHARVCAIPETMWPLILCSIGVAVLVPPALLLIQLATTQLSNLLASSERLMRRKLRTHRILFLRKEQY